MVTEIRNIEAMGSQIPTLEVDGTAFVYTGPDTPEAIAEAIEDLTRHNNAEKAVRAVCAALGIEETHPLESWFHVLSLDYGLDVGALEGIGRWAVDNPPTVDFIESLRCERELTSESLADGPLAKAVAGALETVRFYLD